MSQIPIGWLMKIEGFERFTPLTTGFYDDWPWGKDWKEWRFQNAQINLIFPRRDSMNICKDGRFFHLLFPLNMHDNRQKHNEFFPVTIAPFEDSKKVKFTMFSPDG